MRTGLFAVAMAVLAGGAGAAEAQFAARTPTGSYIRGWTRLIPLTDEYQVAWVVPAVAAAFRNVSVEKDGTIFRAELLPQRLLAASEPIRGRDGAVVAPQGTQFVAMDWPSLLACSLPDKATPSKCLLDEDGDAKPDTYFEGGKGLGRMWFVLNRRMPATRLPLQRVQLRDLPPEQLATKPVLAMRLMRWGSNEKGFKLSMHVGKDAVGYADCAPGPQCAAPPILIQATAGGLSLAGAGRPAQLRFWLVYGPLGNGAELQRVKVTYD